MTPLFLHNTLSGKKEKLKPLALEVSPAKNEVTLYSCGPTVYDFAHIGNFRTFVMSDIIRRTLEYKGYTVKHAMNITDVDDKTIRRSQAEKISLEELTDKYEKFFWEDMQSLNNLRPTIVMGARAHIAAMIALISKLLEKEVAYVAHDGVYVNVLKVKKYGELAHIKKSDLHKVADETHSRIANDEYDKQDPRDFAVWKFSGDVSWDAPFGKGRPGWHIECSAMSMEALGKTIDIHTGGTDLIFPHHTNEIAQSESATGKTFVQYWVHGAFMNVNDEKMSKSKSNFYKIADLKEEQISPIAYRYWLLTSHYRSQINFSFDAVRAAQVALINLCNHIIEWQAEAALGDHISKDQKATEAKYRESFDLYISDDFNMPKAVALLWKIVKDTSITPGQKLSLALDFDAIFGLRLADLSQIQSSTSATKEIPVEITALAEARQAARLAKDFIKADALRIEVESRGYMIKDVGESFTIVER